jgi:hypothetical protein
MRGRAGRLQEIIDEVQANPYQLGWHLLDECRRATMRRSTQVRATE